MADIGKINDVEWASISKRGTVEKANIAKVGIADGPVDNIFWLVWADDRALWSTASVPYLEEHWHKYSMADMTSDCFSVTYGKDHNGDDLWWGCVNNGANALHVASASAFPGAPGPTASVHWTRKNNDSFNHPDSETTMNGIPTDIVYTTNVDPPLWIIVGHDGGYIVSTSGTTNNDDWLSKKNGNAMTTDGSNYYDATTATVSGTTLFVGGTHCLITTASLPNNWSGSNIPHAILVHAYGAGTDCNAMLNANIGTMHYSPGNSNRIMSIGDSSNKSIGPS